MDFKTVLASLISPLLMLIAFTFLALSPLSPGKLVNVQNDIVIVFFENLIKTDIGRSLVNTAEYIWSNLVLTLGVFIFILDLALIFELFASNSIDFTLFFLGSVMALFVPVIVSGFSYMIIAPSIGVMLALLWIYKTFEEKRSDFSSGYQFVLSHIKIVNIFLAVGVFLAVFSGLDEYSDLVKEANMDIIKVFLPDVTALKQVQIDQMTQLTDGFKSSVDIQYNMLSQEKRILCKDMRDSLNKGLDDYKMLAIAEIEKQDISISDEQLSQLLPFMDIFAKATPLFVAIMVYFVVAVINPFLAGFYGFLYFLVKRAPSQDASTGHAFA